MLRFFEVDANGVFKVIYVNAIDELINEAKVVCQIPKLLLQRIMVVQFIRNTISLFQSH
jgi:hypothetical protein